MRLRAEPDEGLLRSPCGLLRRCPNRPEPDEGLLRLSCGPLRRREGSAPDALAFSRGSKIEHLCEKPRGLHPFGG
ncbi:MAG: hypothetical protein WCD18_16385 [Thermosynechococcaceae cyanobacterium]